MNWSECVNRNRMIRVLIFCVICYLYADIVIADNFTTKYMKVHHELPRHQPRFVSFNTDHDGDVTVDLEFAVPFITIPIRKTIDGAWNLYNGGLAKINMGSLVLTGGVIFGAVIVIPLLTSLFMKHIVVAPTQRSIEEEPNETWRILAVIDQALIENNIDTTSCMQRTMCWLAKNSRNKLNSGSASSHDKIIDGLLTNNWINHYIEGSAMQTAINTGLGNENCSLNYKNCKFTTKSMQRFGEKLAKYLQITKK